MQNKKWMMLIGACSMSLLLAACTGTAGETTVPSEASVEETETSVMESSEVSSLYDGRITRAKEGFDAEVVKLQKKNKDTIGWISIDGTENAYPLMQTEDNEFYLLHDFEKKDLPLGLPYLDASNTPWLTDQNSVIYGHMPYGTRTMKFGVLRHLLKQDYVDKSPKTVTITTNQGIYTYRLFSMYRVAADAPYREANVDNKDYQKFLDETLEKSVVDFKLDRPLTTMDRIVTLSTCTIEHDDDYRLAVVGVLEKAELSPDAFAYAQKMYTTAEEQPVDQAQAESNK